MNIKLIWNKIEPKIIIFIIFIVGLFSIYLIFNTNLGQTILIGFLGLFAILAFWFWQERNDLLMLLLFFDMKIDLAKKLNEMEENEGKPYKRWIIGRAYLELRPSIEKAKRNLEIRGDNFSDYELLLSDVEAKLKERGWK